MRVPFHSIFRIARIMSAPASGLEKLRTLAASAVLAIALAGCTMVEATLPMRGYAVNANSSSLREDLILLNIVRASRFEPMNFVSLSKYNASGNLEAGGQGTRNIDFNILRFGTAASTVSAVNSVLLGNSKVNTAANFDLIPLENKEFYAGLLAQIGLETINLLVNAGLSRELVLHALVKAVRVQHINGNWYHYHNDPNNDGYQGSYGKEAHAHCERLIAERAFEVPFQHPVWTGNDCNYQKFLNFLQGALRYGLTTEVVESSSDSQSGSRGGGKSSGKPDPAKSDGGDGPPANAKQVAATSQVVVYTAQQSSGSKSKVVICYDGAIAQEYGRKVVQAAACGSRSNRGNQSVAQPKHTPMLREVQPFLRSPYNVFQYFGQLYATGTVHRVKLIDAGTPRLPTGDTKLLTILKDENLERCFAAATIGDARYCVPSEGANNTKEIFILLNALVNLSTTRSALPLTPTVQIAP